MRPQGFIPATFSLTARAVGQDNTVLLLGVSPSLARRERRLAHRQAEQLGLTVVEVATHELENPSYSANPVDRCYFCKDELFTRLDARVVDELGAPLILVNNAGRPLFRKFLDITVEQWHGVLDVNLTAAFQMGQAVARRMMQRGRGKIINISSLNAELARTNIGNYSASKGGLKMLTRNICAEYGANNIQCNGIGPGYIATPQTAPLREKQPDGSPHPFDGFLRARTPAGRWGTPEDLVGPAVFLASSASDLPVRAISATRCRPVRMPSPVVAYLVMMTCPDCSPPRDRPCSPSASST